LNLYSANRSKRTDTADRITFPAKSWDTSVESDLFASPLPVVAAPRLPVSAASTAAATMEDVEGLDVSVERVEVERRQAADGGAVADEYRVSVLAVQVDRRAAAGRHAAAAV